MSFTQEEKALLLQLHNAYRSMVRPPAKNMRELVWDDDLEEFARQHSQACTGAHSSRSMVKVWSVLVSERWNLMAENLYWSYGDRYSIEEAMWMFWEEGIDYHISNNTCTHWRTCSHYKALVLETSWRVGCSINQCQNFSNNPYPGPAMLMTCSYNGMYLVDARPYTAGDTCSGCTRDIVGSQFANCRNRLCVTYQLLRRNEGFDGNTTIVGLDYSDFLADENREFNTRSLESTTAVFRATNANTTASRMIQTSTTAARVTETSTAVPRVIEASTTAARVTEISTAVPRITQTSTTAARVTETSTAVPRMTQTSTTAARVTETSTAVPRMTQTSTTAARVTETSTSVPRITQTSTTAARVTETSTAVPTMTQTSTTAARVTETSTAVPRVTEIRTTPSRRTEAGTAIFRVTETSTAAARTTEARTTASSVTEISAAASTATGTSIEALRVTADISATASLVPTAHQPSYWTTLSSQPEARSPSTSSATSTNPTIAVTKQIAEESTAKSDYPRTLHTLSIQDITTITDNLIEWNMLPGPEDGGLNTAQRYSHCSSNILPLVVIIMYYFLLF
ncbi:LOW QUALITY PROTEIN: peptidase inhibitor 16 [Plakobranchus ocellatus]|uniref:Peptidase inhibitor 16 n=1 Tax=Plakobranchus ocellatus TaxID=259542 RepID=A0AAV4AAM6_9GAST|nr:LOW QUALITY PROTEIN: peptidase inhibitor 16 [Plakobranchus ocellatus]